MAARKTTEKSTPSSETTPQKETKQNDYMELRIPKIGKGTNGLTIALVILLMVASFAIGMMYMKLQALQGGGSLFAAKPPATVQEAFAQYAGQVGLDKNKFQSCYDSKKYADRVNSQTQEGNSLGVHATPAFYINGKLIGGAFPYEAFKDVIDKELARTGSTNAADYSEQLQQAYADEQNRSFDPIPKQVTLGDAPVRGDTNATVTIVEYSDFQCPFCQRATGTVKQVLDDYKGKLKLVYKHFPISSIHPNAEVAAEASECAREQNKFWEFHDLLFQNQATWSTLPQVAPTT